ncbi:hypothetical protein ACVMGC_003578 [Bradyrhizobium barranii subsp. barranii]|uniref:Uncharacterized protein n=1 Tax=Bradyrhizobium huanghuaihaiense TaxID=990078 RepID=A0A562QPX5_9BRAD|nr:MULTISPECIES: hypothetical protein [Bradyrhizobium]MBR0880583.1 hypothetical protein [Bradyrhizobium liaoningense]PDT55917.1 hypothetical protein CO678_41290 [Bradyrhizobium diazoefficiens]TWI58811.1 hypothetical protein IQ16_08142 [Bradyrhizobium huanghuaihaiense]WLA72455.1 hypothetical protein QIH77_37090 [Bradyrhizobium diazoefficiens]BCE19589.1 hypothetical protein XF1B_22700 [Bradyrhizobium diazoefficiens]
MTKIFVAYPALPADIGQTIEATKRAFGKAVDITTWKRDDLSGQPVIAPILEAISDADIVVGDITDLNFNVVYELGYGIGLGKRALPIISRAFAHSQQEAQEVGIFDTLLYEQYATANDLLGLLNVAQPGRRFATDYPLDPLPLYIVLPPVLTDDANQLVTRARRAGLRPRTYDQFDQARLSATDAVRAVAISSGVVLQLLAPEMKGAKEHNLRTAFVAGISHALGKPTLLLKKGNWPVPLDVRDDTVSYHTEAQLATAFTEFAAKVHEVRYAGALPAPGPKNPLATLNFGDPAAENEEDALDDYFLERDEFRQVLDGRAKIVVGRKGSGKTAIFYQVRNRLKDARSNVIIDLSPEAYQLKKLKDLVLRWLAAGSKEFLLSAFWEYVLLLEICGKLLEKDEDVHKRNHKLFEPYQRLMKFYREETSTAGISFSDRLLRLIDRLSERYAHTFKDREGVDLSDDQLTNLLYQSSLGKLREQVAAYTSNKGLVFILFDNIDKGWNATGLEEADVVIIRTLIEAARKLGNDFRRQGIEFSSSVFLRNDVYEALLSHTSDRGKETVVLVDWTNPQLLAQLVRRRIAHSHRNVDAGQIWHSLCVPMVDGQNSLEFLIAHSMMRPRYLIRLLNYCRGNAINFDRHRIDEQDIKEGLSTYSTETIKEIGLEIRDVLPDAGNVLYAFLGEPREMSRSQVLSLIEKYVSKTVPAEAIFTMLLWHGVLGLRRNANQVTYIHDVNYDILRLKGLIQKSADDDPVICIAPALWAGLEIT